MGRALLGREVGDEITVELPSGRSVVLRVKDIRYQRRGRPAEVRARVARYPHGP